MLRKHAGNIVFVILMLLILIPATRKPIQTAVNRLLLFKPSAEAKPMWLDEAAMNWQVKNEQGQIITMADLKGKPMLINFWATWCPPCMAEMPSIERAYVQRGKSAHFILVSNEPIEKLMAWKRRKGYTFPVYQAVSGIPAPFTSETIPATFVLNKNNELVIMSKRPRKWDSDTVLAFLK